MAERTQAERITALEENVKTLADNLEEANAKLDELLSLKNKGLGAFWVVSILIGAGWGIVINFVSGWWNG